MSKKENQSIVYIYDEMDPSEKVEFERDLRNDSNLLIEVESFKNVSERLNQISHFNPPNDLTELICDRAVAIKKNKSRGSAGRYYVAAAALILIGFTSGMFLMDFSENETENQPNTAAVGSTVLNFDYRNLPTGSQAVSESSGKKIKPWVDENDVIHFYDRIRTSESASVDSIFRHSFQKLTPVTDPAQAKPFQRQLHLTGGSR